MASGISLEEVVETLDGTYLVDRRSSSASPGPRNRVCQNRRQQAALDEIRPQAGRKTGTKPKATAGARRLRKRERDRHPSRMHGPRPQRKTGRHRARAHDPHRSRRHGLMHGQRKAKAANGSIPPAPANQSNTEREPCRMYSRQGSRVRPFLSPSDYQPCMTPGFWYTHKSRGFTTPSQGAHHVTAPLYPAAGPVLMPAIAFGAEQHRCRQHHASPASPCIPTGP